MKKIFASVLALSLLLVGCGKSDDSKAEIVMLTDKGTIDDKSFNQGTWEGVKAYADENNISSQYIKPVDSTTDDYCNSIDQAVKQGAKVIVTPGFLFEKAIFIKQEEYPDVKFVLIDGNPNNNEYTGDYQEKTTDNTIGIKFQEEQSGYLAGYAAVKDGNTKLGFMGGQAVPAVMSFGYGYAQGANDAAKELGIDVTMKYHYTGGFNATPENQNLATSWYKDGVQVIFGCGGAVGNSVMAAAETANPVGKVIGVDVDQASESATVISSAYKQLSVAVKDALNSIYNGDFDKLKDETVLFRGGQNIVLGAKENATGLPFETSKFEKFSQEDYDALYKEIADGKIEIKNFAALNDKQTVKDLNLSNVTIDLVK